MLVALVVSAVVMSGAVTLLMNQQRSFQSGASDRGMQETARVALQEITGNLRMAGFGVDPPLAFDFGFADNIPMVQAPRVAGVNVRMSPSYKCVTPVSCRDSAAGPDEIVFYSRDPAFGHAIASVGGTSTITMAGPLNVPLYQGQVLQAMCYGGTMVWAYVTVGAYVATSAAATIAVSLAPNPGSALDFPTQNGTLADPCFNTGTARLFKVDRYRYYIDNRDSAGNPAAYEAPASRPFLMLDQGLTDQNGLAIATAIAPDVEDLQFAYQYPLAPITLVGAPPGTAAGTAIPAGAGGIDLAPAGGAPGYGTPLNDPSRLNQHPANIRAVQVSIVVRSDVADATIPDQTVPAAGNRPGFQGLANFRRLVFQTTTAVQNLGSLAPYYPSYSANAGADQLNLGGG
jgi:type IV pilus assembly protein PilW